MKKKHTAKRAAKPQRKMTRVTSAELARLKDRTDWARVNALTDAEIEQAIADDPDAAPPLDAEWFRRAQWREPEPKHAISLRVDESVLEFFKSGGPGYQSRMNAVLKAYAEHAKRAG